MNWKIGKHKSTVVSEEIIQNTFFPSPSESEIEYYGGYLVCESVGNKEIAQLISAAPDLLEACRNLENDDGSIPEHAWKKVQDAINKATFNP